MKNTTNIFALILCLFSIICCQNKQKVNDLSSFDATQEIVFYRILNLDSINFDSTNGKSNQFIQFLLFDNEISHLTDSTLTKQLDKYYKKFNVDLKSNKEIIEIIKNAGLPIVEASFATAICLPTYRDILVFKKNDKTRGVIKICFDCGQNFVFIDNVAFNDSKINYEKLQTILNRLAIEE